MWSFTWTFIGLAFFAWFLYEAAVRLAPVAQALTRALNLG
jgi:hypothetical protein